MNPERNISTLQESIWLTQNIYPHSPLFNVGGYACITGSLDRALLEKAIVETLHKEDVIGIGYYAFNNQSLQDNRSFTSIDISTLTLENTAACEIWMQKDMRVPFDPAANLLKTCLLQAGDVCYWYMKVHHMLFDGYAMALLFNKVAALYTAWVRGNDIAVAAAYPYTAYIEDERQYKRSEQFEEDRQFWVRRLKDAGRAEGFKSFLQVNNKTSMRAVRKEIKIDKAIFQEISTFCKEQGCTAFHYFLTCLFALHKLYNNDEALIVGIPVFNRRNQQFKETVGAFVNILPFSVVLSDGITFNEILQLVAKELKECYRHQRFPLYDILKELDRAGNIYNVSFSFQKNTYDTVLGDAQASIRYLPAPEQQDDIFFHLLEYEAGQDVTLALDLSDELFPAYAGTQLLQHFEQLLKAGMHLADQPATSFNVLTKSEEHTIRNKFNKVSAGFPEEDTIVTQFERRVAFSPGQTALTFEGRSLTYRELDMYANQLGNYLQQEYGIGADDLVGLELARSEWQVISILGILKAGGAYVPVDPAYPEERKRYMMEDSRCKLYFNAAKLAEFISVRDSYSQDALQLQAKADNLAYVIYTSGSTGQPKGVMIGHRQVISFFSNFDSSYLFEPGLVWASATNYTFDISVLELLGTLVGGVHLLLLSSTDPKGILAEMTANDVTILQLTPSRLNQLTESSEYGVHGLAGLKYLLVGGEALSQQQYEQLKQLTNTRVLNMYGPTEATIWSSSLEIGASEVLSIGRPLANEHIYIMNDHQQLCPVGVMGEICIGGAGLALGYLHRPELTAARFVQADTRIYRTGDLGRWLPDGTIAFGGRRDNQVKVRGYRIEPGEIVYAMELHPEIGVAVVDTIDNTAGEKELVAWFTGNAGISITAIRSFLEQHLPAYLIPDHFMHLPAFPLNSSGKIDRKQLPVIESDQAGSGREYIAPRNETEEQLLLIWQEVLGRKKIGVLDHFFELGGHSLKATRLLSHVEKAFDVEIALHELFSAPILKDQALLIARAGKATYKGIQQVAEQASYKLSSSQRRLWVLSQFAEGNEAYNMPGAYVFEGTLNLASLEYAFSEIIRRHEILRTVFNEDEQGEVRQYILPAWDFKVEYVDLRNGSNQQTRLQQLTERAAIKPFDLSRGPLLRACLYQTAENSWVFAYTMHHIIGDGWSMDVLMRELLIIYNAHVRNLPHTLPALRIQYKEYAEWQQSRLHESSLHDDKAYWLSQFEEEVTPLALRLDHLRPSVRTYDGGAIRKQMPVELSKGLKKLVQQEGATLFMGLLGVINVLLHRYTQQEDIIIGTPIAGRSHADLSDQIGVYINTLALRTRFKAQQSFLELLSVIRQNMLGAYEHQAYPFDELVEQLELARDMSRNALFDVMVILQNNESRKLEGSGLLHDINISQYESHAKEISKLDITFEFEETDHELSLKIQYNSSLFETATIHRMAGHLEQLLSEIVLAPDRPLHNFPLLTPAEEHEILEQFNVAVDTYTSADTIISRFAWQAAAHPERIMLQCEGRFFTYRELDMYSNQLSHFLQQEHGVKVEELVGLELPRNEWLVISMLGIQKAGGAYVSIDPTFPEERKRYIQEDSRCKLVLDETVLAQFIIARTSYSAAPLPLQAGPDNLAYVLYTSGSTGNPKGVMIAHRQLTSFFTNFDRIGMFAPDMVMAATTNYTFDISLLELLGPMAGGVPVLLLSTSDPELMLAELKAGGVTILQLTPSRLNQLTESSEDGMASLRFLKWLMVGGEAMGQQQFERLQELTGTRVLNMYGPTETTVWSSMLELLGTKTLTIGRPLDYEYMYILDDRLQLCPIGITGEICIGGAGLARGYLNREDLTAEKFVADPYRPGKKIYRTGDLGHWNPDGSIGFIGRKDSQIKIRGYRIELGEIERVLQGYSQIDASVILVKPNPGGEKEMVVYFVSGQQLAAAEIRAYLQQKLPVYMLPDHYVQMAAFPLNSSGKVDRKKLPDPDMHSVSAGRELVAPRNEVEVQLVAIWEEVLGRKGISVLDHFFEIGGHSLKATRLASRINKELGIRISLKDLFSHAILEEQATFITSAEKAKYTGIGNLDEQTSYVLSSSQRRLWVLSQFEESNAAYNMPGVFILKGDLQLSLLTAAFNKVIARHEILRTVFNSDESGEVRQYILPARNDFQLSFRDVQGQEAGLPVLIKRFCSMPFDLASGPLLRVALYQTHEDKWVLAFVMHHIISDGWSLGVLIRELMQVYANGIENELPPLPVQYKDYAAWQHDQLSGAKLIAHSHYWLTQFSGELPVLELISDRPRPAVKTYGGGIVRKAIDKTVVSAFEAMLQSEGCTLFMGLLTVVNALLYRYTAQEDIIVGSPVAGREDSDLEGQIGMYVNTLALRSRFSGNNSFRELLGTVKAVMLDAYEHQAYPFDELVENLHLQRDMSRNPLFDVMVLLQDRELTPVLDNTQMTAVTILPYKGEQHTVSKFDLTFIFEPSPAGLDVSIEYSGDLYNESTIERMARHFEQLLVAMLEHPATAVRELEYLSSEEKDKLLFRFNDTRVAYPSSNTLVELFEEQVATTPERTALVFGSTVYNYRELDELSARFANFLQQQYHIRTGDLVAIRIERSQWLMVSILGILKAGAAYVPLDLSYPEERISFMLEDTKCKVVITADIIEQFRATAGCYDTFHPVCMSNADSLAYIMYTSGSTGTPKGVMVTHRNIVRLVKSAGFVDLGGQHVLLSTGAVSFDATTFEYWGMLLNGGKLVLCSQDDLLDEQQMAALISAHQVDMMWFTAGWLHQLIDKDISVFAGLKTILAGGDKLSSLHINRLRRHYPGMQVINGYGPTENTTFSLTYTVHKVMADIPLGYPLNNSTAYIMDSHLRLCPPGVKGEIVVGGDGLAIGYLNREDLTSQKFIPHPYIPGERLYRTGDLGRWLADGNIAFMGRADDQVKIRGYRIELGEIEHLLQEYPGIAAAVVTVVNTLSGEKELVSYFTGDAVLDITAIRDYLSRQLPAYMVPAYFLQMESFPLTPNGKVDRKKLPAIGEAQASGGREYVAPRNETEEKLVAIWEEILGRKGISVKDNFFEVGGHSLRATRLASQLVKVFDVKVPLKELFNAPVLEDLALLLGSSAPADDSTILPVAPQESYLLSSSQRRLWLLSQLEDGNVAYNIPGVFVFTGELHMDAFRFAFQELISRHEILRTYFKENTNGEIHQYILPVTSHTFSVDYVDLQHEADNQAIVRELVKAEARKGFDLEKAPLLRASIYQTDKHRWVFAYTMHHIISDAWSMGILIREMLQIYNMGTDHGLAPLPIQYKDYAAWQREQLEDGQLAADQVYWLLQFEGELPVLQMPVDHPRPAFRNYNSQVVYRELPQPLVQSLHGLCQQEGVTLFMVMMSVVNTLLHRYTGQEDIIVGTPVAGRNHASLQDQIGFYVNTLAIRTRFNSHDTFAGLLGVMKDLILAGFEHQSYPLDELVEQLNLQRDTSRNALFDVMVTLKQQDDFNDGPVTGLRGLQVKLYEEDSLDGSKFDITYEFIEHGNRLGINLKYNSDLYDAATIEHMAGHLEQLIRSVTARPYTPLYQLSYLEEAEEALLLSTFGNSKHHYDNTTHIVALFEAQVKKTPAAPALVYEDIALTYDELNKAANRIAHQLIRHYQPGAVKLTGLLVDRSEMMLTGLLGILKSGRGYVPVDPAFPASRIAYLLADSQVEVLVTKRSFLPLLEDYTGTIICLDDIIVEADLDPLVQIVPADLAYMIYTSGSTGNPKGVMIAHQSLVDYTYGVMNRTNISQCRSFGLISTIAADLGNTVIFPALLTGGCLHIFSNNALMSGEELFASPVDCIKIVPSHWKALQPENGPLFTPDKCLIFGGEALTADVVNLLIQGGATCEVYNHYGPSETTIGKLITPITLDKTTTSIPLGAPFCNSFVCILDTAQQLTGIGIIGEICISGDGVSAGYFNRAALTAERFVPNPYRPGTLMYKTGDLGRWLPDGRITFEGRKDDQVKIRGYRVELGEIVNLIQLHPAINTAVVTTHRELGLVCYYTTREPLDADQLQQYLGAQLPAYAIPTAYMRMDELPFMANGKVDKKKLPDPVLPEKAYTPAETPVQVALLTIWSGILNRQVPGIDNNFFEMGGHSLLAIRLVNRINSVMGTGIKVKHVFTHTTIRKMAQLIESAGVNESKQIPLAPLRTDYVLSTNQRRLWLASQQSPDSVAYNIPGALLLEGPLDVARLQVAFEQLSARHESLRTVLVVNSDDEPRQRIVDTASPDFTVITLNNMPAEDELAAMVQQESAISFTLYDRHLIRVRVVCFPDQRYLLMVVMHHIISDGWSMEIFIRELIAIYSQVGHLAPLSIQYKDYAEWQQTWLQSDAFADTIRYWQQRLAGKLPVLHLPFARPRTPESQQGGALYSFEVPTVLYRRLQELCVMEHATLFNVLFTGFNVLLYHVSHQQEIMLGTSVAGREHASLEPLMGFFVNTLAIRTTMEGDETFTSLLHRTGQALLNDFEHQQMPFEELLNYLSYERVAGINPLFQARFVLNNDRNDDLAGLTLEGIRATGIGMREIVSKFDMSLVMRAGSQLTGSVEYRPHLYDSAMIALLCNAYIALLEALLQDPQQTVSRLDTFNDAYRHQLEKTKNAAKDNLFKKLQSIQKK